jgi:hypothetical protein
VVVLEEIGRYYVENHLRSEFLEDFGQFIALCGICNMVCSGQMAFVVGRQVNEGDFAVLVRSAKESLDQVMSEETSAAAHQDRTTDGL